MQTFSRRNQAAGCARSARSPKRRPARPRSISEHGLRAGDVVVLVGTHHIDFYAAWLGCVWLGGIPTVLAEPSVRVAKEIYWSRLGELLARIGAWGLAADPKLKIENSLLVVPHTFRYDEIAAGAGPVPPRGRPAGPRARCSCSTPRARPACTRA